MRASHYKIQSIKNTETEISPRYDSAPSMTKWAGRHQSRALSMEVELALEQEVAQGVEQVLVQVAAVMW